ncbi:MAG TPA: hypothetical protein VHM23_19685 [Actinomycetota bacterium]|jgi:hypothetical protein|nr:hypothetical protein [Actinomycetota bacterium]
MSDGTERRESGLWVAHGFNFLRHRAAKRTITLPSGERALVRTDDSGTVTEVEVSRRGAGVSERQDAIVRPRVITLRTRTPRVGG